MPIDPLRQIWIPMLYGKLAATPDEFRRQAASAREHGFVGIAEDLWHAANEEEVRHVLSTDH